MMKMNLQFLSESEFLTDKGCKDIICEVMVLMGLYLRDNRAHRPLSER